MTFVIKREDADRLAEEIDRLVAQVDGVVVVDGPLEPRYGVIGYPKIRIMRSKGRAALLVDGVEHQSGSPYYTPSELAEFVIWPLRTYFNRWVSAFNVLIATA